MLAQSGMLQSPSTVVITNATLVWVAVFPSGPAFVNGTTQKFSVIGRFSDGSTQDLSSAANWQSSNPAVATISNTGLASGTGVGTVQLSGTFEQFPATGTFSDGTTQNLTSLVTWSSSMPSVATINQSDMAEAAQFAANYQGVTGTTGTIQVTQTTLVSFTISPTSATIA